MTLFEKIRAAPHSDWPPRGSTTQSCGCETSDFEMVRYADWDVHGPTVVYASYCPKCALSLKISGYYLHDEAAGDRWLDEERIYDPNTNRR